MLKGEEFKRYVNKLRGKSTIYKKKRMELSELQAEVGVLSRTEELLKAQEQQAQAYLSNLEAKHGVSGRVTNNITIFCVSSFEFSMHKSKSC